MNTNDPNTKNEINKILLVSLLGFALLIGCAYMIDSYLEMFIISIFAMVLVFYATNKKVQDFIHSCKWF